MKEKQRVDLMTMTVRLPLEEFDEFKTLCHREEKAMAAVAVRAIRVEVNKLRKKYPGVCKKR